MVLFACLLVHPIALLLYTDHLFSYGGIAD
jgi:hypothetical protein